MEQRFAAGDGYALQHALPFFEKADHFLLFIILIHKLRQNQWSIMAERTTEVAAAGKNRAGHSAGIVKKGQLLQTGNKHRSSCL